METLLVILIVVVWISLYSHISKMNSHTDSLRKDLYSLRKYIEIQLEELKKQQAAMAPVEEKPEEAVVSVPVAEEVVVPVIPVTPVTVVEERTEKLGRPCHHRTGTS